MYVELGAYQCHAFMDFRFVGDKEWGEIHLALNGAGVPSMQDEWGRRFGAGDEVGKTKEARGKPALSKTEGKNEGVKRAGKPKTVKKTKVSPKAVAKKKTPAAKVKAGTKKQVKKSAKLKAVTKKAVKKTAGKKKKVL